MKDKTRQDKTRQDKTRQDKTRQDKTRQDKTRQDKTRQDKTRQDKTRQDKTREEKRREDFKMKEKRREMKEEMILLKNVSNQKNPPDELAQKLFKKIPFRKNVSFESSESHRVFNYLLDSNLIFGPAGITLRVATLTNNFFKNFEAAITN